MRLHHHPLPSIQMGARGSTVLRALQNNSCELLDLLVRESIQNSIDARSCRNSKVEVNFTLSKLHNPAFFASLFPEIETPSGNVDFLEIQDFNTIGLTGSPFWSQEYEGNLAKLVYDLGIPQSTQGSGGSWGLGKTVFYRFGIGLVLYASRTKSEGDRLVACMVEDETSDRRRNTSSPTGISWWGEAHPSGSQAITDSRTINKILDSIGCAPMDRPGTKVIIPFFEGSRIPSLPEYSERWYSTIDEYLALAIQKWYCPLLENGSYQHGHSLVAKVNGKNAWAHPFPVFNLVHEANSVSLEDLPAKGWKIQDVRINATFESPIVGKLAFRDLDDADLGMCPPDNHVHPFRHLGIDGTEDSGCKIIGAYRRKPGMILTWNDKDMFGPNVRRRDSERNSIFLFFPISDLKFSETFLRRFNPKDKIIALEDYLRKTEKADHMKWTDLQGFDVISRISKGIERIMTSHLEREQHIPSPQKIPLDLSRAIADLILPEGWSNDGAHPAQSASSLRPQSTQAGNDPSLRIISQSFGKKELEVAFSLYCGKLEFKTFLLQGGVVGFPDGMDCDKIFSITSASFYKIRTKRRGNPPSIHVEVSRNNHHTKDDRMEAELTEGSIKISLAKDYDFNGASIEGKILFIVNNPTYKPQIKLAMRS